MLLSLSTDFFFQEYHKCQTFWIQTRPDVLSSLISVQTVCKGTGQKKSLSGKEMRLTLHLLVPSADILCKQFGLRSGFKLLDTLMVFLKELSEKADLEYNQQRTKESM